MAEKTPLLDQLRVGKKQVNEILRPVVEEWLVKYGYRLDKYDDSDWAVLKDLITKGARRDRRVFSPSGATLCRRRQVIDKHRDFKPLPNRDPGLIRIFDDGKWRHLRWQMLFFKMGIVESMEQFQTFGKFDYGGSYDVIARLKINGKKCRVLIDIKGTNAASFNNIKFLNVPTYSHRVQVSIYMHLNNIDFAIIWYENKNTQEICEIVIRKDEVYEKIIKKFTRRQQYMRRYVEMDVFPKEECDVKIRDNKFASCPQRNNCLCLPVYLIDDEEIIKVGEPRRQSEQSKFAQRNELPLKKLKGFRGARKVHSKI